MYPPQLDGIFADDSHQEMLSLLLARVQLRDAILRSKHEHKVNSCSSRVYNCNGSAHAVGTLQ